LKSNLLLTIAHKISNAQVGQPSQLKVQIWTLRFVSRLEDISHPGDGLMGQ